MYLPVADKKFYGESKQKYDPAYIKKLVAATQLAIGSTDTFKHLRHCDEKAQLGEVLHILQNHVGLGATLVKKLEKIVRKISPITDDKFNAILKEYEASTNAQV